MAEFDASPPVALITGSSRGIGAETARLLSRRSGARIVVNYRDKRRRAEKVVADIEAAGGQAMAVQADLTDSRAVGALLDAVAARFGRIDLLILNAAGGMEQGAEPGYALRLNRDAQLSLVDRALPLMPRGARIVFVTSHLAHFHGTLPVIDDYEIVARSKRAGETALRERIPELADRGIDLVLVSGDMIEGTATVLLRDRANPGIVAERRGEAGSLPTVAEFAAAVAQAAVEPHDSGDMIFVGGADYLARAAG